MLAVDQFALTGVDPGADLDAEFVYAVADLQGAVDCAGGAVEGGVEAVAGGVILDATPTA